MPGVFSMESYTINQHPEHLLALVAWIWVFGKFMLTDLADTWLTARRVIWKVGGHYRYALMTVGNRYNYACTTAPHKHNFSNIIVFRERNHKWATWVVEENIFKRDVGRASCLPSLRT